MDRLTSNRSSEELTEAAIRRGGSTLKRVASQLSRREPCERSVARVAAALRESRIEHWVAALLLRSIRHRAGFEVVCEMFDDDGLSYAGSYLASALLEIDPVGAAARLVHLVEHAATQTGRDEAVEGLRKLGPSAGRGALLRAASAGRLSPHVAAPLVVEWGIDTTTVANWLSSGEQAAPEIACSVIALEGWHPSSSSRTCQWTMQDRARLLELARLAVTHGRADPKPYVRTALRRPNSYATTRARL